MKRAIELLALALSVSALSPALVHAEEGSIGHYVPGALSTIIDLPPTKPGWVIESIYSHYSGDASASRSFPLAGLVTTGLAVETDAAALGLLYTFDETLLGAHYTLGTFVPYVFAEVSGSVTTSKGTLSRKESVNGIGDITIIPAMLAWKNGPWQFNALLSVYAPTGDYELGRLANTGMNYWTFDPTVGVAYSNEKTGFNALLFGGITINTENEATNYRSGSVFHLEGSVTQLLPLGKGFVGIGANAFYYQQVTGDSGSGTKLGGFEGMTAGVGPVLNYILPIGKNTLAAEVKWLPELDTKNRLQGDSVWVKAVFQF